MLVKKMLRLEAIEAQREGLKWMFQDLVKEDMSVIGVQRIGLNNNEKWVW